MSIHGGHVVAAFGAGICVAALCVGTAIGEVEKIAALVAAVLLGVGFCIVVLGVVLASIEDTDEEGKEVEPRNANSGS